jgi:hypothetical protein
MKTLLGKFGQPVEHPEFMWPGFLTIVVGLVLGALPLIFGFDSRVWEMLVLPMVMVACGVLLLMRTIVGSVLFSGLLGYRIYSGLQSVSPDEIDWIGLILKLLMSLALGFMILEQFKYHRHRRTKSVDFILSPPDQTL